MTNTQGVVVGPHGYVRCLVCDKEVSEISREVSQEWAYCLGHRPTTKFHKGEQIMPGTATKEKKPRTRKNGDQPIEWFKNKTEDTKDVDEIRAAAKRADYAASTISIQIGRLRKAGLLPKAEPKAKKEKKTSTRARKAKAEKTVAA